MNDTDNDPQTTHFGFETVPLGQKVRRVRRVFDSVASRYDLMNDCMSFGVHRLWKALATHVASVRRGAQVLDLAAGTCDLTARLARRVGPEGRIVAADINEAMIRIGRTRLLDRGIAGNVAYVQADGERLPFPANSFDCAIIAFGLRNITRKDQALAAMYRVLKPGGQALILEFSHPPLAVVRRLYDEYSFRVLPWLGKTIAGDAESYRYLAESIRRHPDQGCLKTMMEEAGFERCDFLNLSAGIVALHRGYKF